MRMRVTPGAVVGTAALVIALSGTAVAATGGTFLLGHINRTTSNTVIANSKGTALVLAGKKGIAPFGVNGNKVKVPSLNADLLDGLDSTKFQQRVSRTVRQHGDLVHLRDRLGHLHVRPSPVLHQRYGDVHGAGRASPRSQLLARGGGGSGGNSGTTANFGRGGGGGQGGLTTTLVSVTAGQAVQRQRGCRRSGTDRGQR